MNTIETKAFARVGLLGNPSDIYGGKGISCTIDKGVELSLKKNHDLVLNSNYEGTEKHNTHYNGKHDLVKACINYLGLQNQPFEITYNSTIPKESGLAGSTAIIMAALRALQGFSGIKLSKYDMAELAMKIETNELGIACGPQDRYIISFQGIAFMDFAGKEFQKEADPFARIEPLDFNEVPFFIACSDLSKKSALVHNDLRNRFLRGENWIKEEMDKLASLCTEGKKCLANQDWKGLGKLMNKNFEFRKKYFTVDEADLEIIETALAEGALGAKLAGSGGAIAILYENDNAFNVLSEKFNCFKPKIVS
ncbi:MAG: hypothetical protein CL943_00710 [Candidatus Diapherotrites archaeon]|uniref:GHMP kinase n=1 Tax=Candidatus Iainarchaeum sp. TaxID=3101447 RepID=A0A2D6M063_9ARCH|nr:hypothetical protein [Candidatus Diapherotrites archaeon]